VKRIIVANSKEMKTGCNLAECSDEGYGSKWAVLPMMTTQRISDLFKNVNFSLCNVLNFTKLSLIATQYNTAM
jgi:hypothetical protein